MAVQRLYPDQAKVQAEFPAGFVGLDEAGKRAACLQLIAHVLDELATCDREPDEWETAQVAAALGAVASGMFSAAASYGLKAVVPVEDRLPKFSGYNDMSNGTLLQLQNGLQRISAAR